MPYSITDLRLFVRDGARNANDASTYGDARIDRQIQLAMREWARLTRTPRQLDIVNLTIGSATVGAMPTGFLPELDLGTYLTIAGKIISPGITFTTIEEVLRSQANGYVPNWNTPAAPTTPVTGQPSMIAFKDQANAILNTLPDQAYALNIWWQAPLTLWTPGGTGPTFNLPDEHLLVIASLGAVYYLQKNEPSNSAGAMQSHNDFLAEARRITSRGAGGKGAKVLVRSDPWGA